MVGDTVTHLALPETPGGKHHDSQRHGDTQDLISFHTRYTLGHRVALMAAFLHYLQIFFLRGFSAIHCRLFGTTRKSGTSSHTPISI